jgi:quercetin dioxygenase-like cupin family protein
MKITCLKEIERTKMAMEGAKGVWKQVPISKAAGSPNFSVRVFTIEPGGHTPYHAHPFEHLNYIIEGEGVVIREDGTECPVKAGDFALVLPDEKHQYKNLSPAKPMMMICAVPKEYE